MLDKNPKLQTFTIRPKDQHRCTALSSPQQSAACEHESVNYLQIYRDMLGNVTLFGRSRPLQHHRKGARMRVHLTNRHRDVVLGPYTR